MNECYGKKFILNGELQPAELFDNSLVYDGESVYEVIRMVRGNPVFFYDHMERLGTSVKLQNKRELAEVYELRRSIINLTKYDKKKNINLKIVFNYNKGSDNYLVYFIEPIYPSESQYRKGVKGILFFAERKDPESKVINHKLRSSIYHKLILEGAYEALLVNENNCVTEGSRSNIFFVKGETLVTAPDNIILNGITRKHILEICMENHIKVEFTAVRVEDISEYDSVFITGTSPIVLPFYCIGDKPFAVKLPLIDKLRKLLLLSAGESIQFFISEL
ncbi:MAG TPA: aminotransferase class IV [Bacteroidales bacterium]|nr:aminotransferase class IV [Bacteroidales bacterium]